LTAFFPNSPSTINKLVIKNPSLKKSVSNIFRSAVNGKDQKKPAETRKHYIRKESTETETLMLQEAEDAVAMVGAEGKEE